MKRVSVWAGLMMLAVAFVVGTGFSGDTKKAKVSLPTNWKKLDLSKEQIGKILTVRSQFRAKIKGLEDQLKALKTQETREMVKVLTESQKEKLTKLTLGETDDKKTPPKDKDKER